MTLYLACLYLIYKSTVRYKKSFALFLAVFCFLTRNVRVIFVPLSTVTILWFALLFFLKRKNYKQKIKSFPWKIPLLIWGVSLCVSSVFSISGFSSEITTLLGNLLKGIVLILILWCVTETKADFYRIYNYLSVVFFVSCVYGIIEYCLGNNPLQNYLALFSGTSNAVVWTYDDIYRGYRICSIFEHAMGAAVNWSMYAIFTFYLYIKRNRELKHKTLCIITAMLCLVCVFLTKCRAPLAFLVIFAIVILYQFRYRRFFEFLIMFSPLILAGGYFALAHSTALQSIIQIVFSGDNGQIGASSSVGLRYMQIETSFDLLKMSPLWGLGTNYKSVLPESLTYYILGGESLLISVPASYGILGLMANFVMIVFDVIFIPKKFKSREAIILGVAYWITRILTSVPGIMTYIYYLMMIFFIKVDGEWKQDEIVANTKI